MVTYLKSLLTNSLERNRLNVGESKFIFFVNFALLVLLSFFILSFILLLFWPFLCTKLFIFPRFIFFPGNFIFDLIKLRLNLLLFKLCIDCFNDTTFISFNPTIILFLVFSSSISSVFNIDLISNLLFFL